MNASKSLKIALAQRELNQGQFAAICGISQPSMSGLVSRKNWNCESLMKVSKALGLKVSEFIKLGEE